MKRLFGKSSRGNKNGASGSGRASNDRSLSQEGLYDLVNQHVEDQGDQDEFIQSPQNPRSSSSSMPMPPPSTQPMNVGKFLNFLNC